jgi:[protein-PII] uridylyltransferase
MQIKTKDKKGLLAFIMNLFEDLKIEIVSAKSYTIKNRAYDMFLIDKNGNFCKNLDTILEELSV